jgi:hypothetical protein
MMHRGVVREAEIVNEFAMVAAEGMGERARAGGCEIVRIGLEAGPLSQCRNEAGRSPFEAIQFHPRVLHF